MAPTPPKGRLTPAELAEAAVLADLTVLIIIVARLTPFAGATTIIGAIPFAVLGLRHRNRVLAVAFAVGVILTFLMAGFTSSTQLLVMATFGGVVGRSARYGWSRSTTVGIALVVGWVTVASLTLGFLAVFSGFRELSIEAAEIQWRGLGNGLRRLGLDAFVDALDPRVAWALDNWFLSVPAFQFVISILITLLISNIGTPAIRRVDAGFSRLAAQGAPAVVPGPDQPLGPVPVRLSSVLVDRGRAELEFDDLDIAERGLTIITGPNGAGKSTLLGVIGGRIAPAAGRVERPGRVGLGEPGGTAVIGQRPESQIVGARVLDDLAWGFTERPSPDAVAAVLDEVGLTGFEQRETGSLSGGELQRLAIAGALLRQPSLILSDESTAMLDPAARSSILEILRRVSERAAVIHVTHLDAELVHADRIISLADAP